METLSSRIDKAREALTLAGPRLALLYASTVLALVTLRVQSQGLTGKLYSSRPVPTFFFTKEALNAGGRNYIKKNRTGTWAGLRAAEGLPVDAVYLTHSGRMIRALTTTGAGNQGAVFFARIIAADAESASKVEHNLKRYGNWLLPTPSEEAEAQAAVQAEVVRILKTVFQA
ncbi:hypothetical protein [Hymenobacter ruber]